VRSSSSSVSNLSLLKLDLGDIAQATQAGEAFVKSSSRLDMLILSAGIMIPGKGLPVETKDGYEIHVGTNVIGHYAFTAPLVPLMKKTAKEAPKDSVRMVWVSSAAVSRQEESADNQHYGMAPATGINYPSVTESKKLFGSMEFYGQRYDPFPLRLTGIVNLEMYKFQTSLQSDSKAMESFQSPLVSDQSSIY
jgi:NAD(P)-dependent dehydrogenase (short-subunit alcohol dehydrogenase family)